MSKSDINKLLLALIVALWSGQKAGVLPGAKS